jgi:hypothetical protein
MGTLAGSQKFLVGRYVLVSSLSLALASVLSASACSSSNEGQSAKSCTPGASVACVGVGACAGGQTCNADGTGYLACDCSASPEAGSTSNDSGSQASEDSGSKASEDSGSKDAAVPTKGALHVTWTLTNSSGTPITCAHVATQKGVAITLTKQDGSFDGSTDVFSCAAGRGDITELAFGSYKAVADLVNEQDQSLGSSPSQSVALSASGCEETLSGYCTKTLEVIIKVD